MNDQWADKHALVISILKKILSGVLRSTTPGETKLLASEIYELLQASSSTEAEPADEPISTRRKAQFFLGSSNKKAKTIILHIDGLDDPVSHDIIQLALCEEREEGMVQKGSAVLLVQFQPTFSLHICLLCVVPTPIF